MWTESRRVWTCRGTNRCNLPRVLWPPSEEVAARRLAIDLWHNRIFLEDPLFRCSKVELPPTLCKGKNRASLFASRDQCSREIYPCLENQLSRRHIHQEPISPDQQPPKLDTCLLNPRGRLDVPCPSFPTARGIPSGRLV